LLFLASRCCSSRRAAVPRVALLFLASRCCSSRRAADCRSRYRSLSSAGEVQQREKKKSSATTS
ncbi:hypothetical protein, partial [Microbacterium sp.]|uniref:hypothetical protein n=1 Tax=Microbacterium sp. TaxID=51671 RepID=UPI0039E2D424